MKDKLLNYFFDNPEDFEAHKPYIKAILIITAVCTIVNVFIKIMA